ncbi:hypothetical protein GCM10009827_112570 [Dactylosporangium maewongense]|uniref:Transmembrane protein n=1 Tax=Dactylosporangium maewongense TaxID=634393 RepID=A0ABN2D807_9ACTN
MLRFARWVLLAFCLLSLVPLLTGRGGLGEYLRGASLTTAHVGTCVEDIDELERSHITCTARWPEGAGDVIGIAPEGVTAVDAGVSGSHYEVRLPGGEDLRVFARGAEARAADSKSMLVGGGVLLVTVALLAWELTVVVRRRRS